MILNEAAARRFYDIYASLLSFADWCLDLDALDFEADDIPTEDSQYEVASKVWCNPSVIDEFVRQNPQHLSTRDLRVVTSWKDVLFETMNYVRQPDGSVDFLYEDHVFTPKGITQEIGTLLNADHGMVEVALLPFEDDLTYASQIQEHPIGIGTGLRAMQDTWFAEARDAGKVITNGCDFLAVVPGLKEQALERKTQKFIEDTAYDMNPPTSWPGVHRGKLADIPHEERDELIMAETRRLFARSAGSDTKVFMRSQFDSWCRKGEATTDFAGLAALEKNAVLTEIAKDLGATRTSKLNKAQLVGVCAEKLRRPEVNLNVILRELLPVHFPFIKRLVEADGRIEIPYAELESLKGLPENTPLLNYWFDEGDHATCVMPDLVRKRLAERDIEDLSRHYAGVAKLWHVIDLLNETRGMFSADDAACEFLRLYPGALAPDECVNAIIDYATSDFCPCETLWHVEGPRMYIADSALLDEFQGHGLDIYVKGELNCCDDLGPLKGLLNAREGKEPWPLPQELVDSQTIADWAQNLPTGRTLLQFMNENVPDDKNDYLFADKMFEDIVYMICVGHPPAMILEAAADEGLAFEDMRQENKLTGYIFGLYNDLPRWDNNGWPPAILHSKLTGKPDFRNEDGSRMKVGRNDPCPCGSGKKYKKCCGR